MDAALSSSGIDLEDLLRAAREFAGLSRSELAARMGVSWETVRQAEEGRDPRHSTLVRYLDALPCLSPRALLLGDAVGPPLASRSVWKFYRDLYGFSVRRLVQIVQVQPGGGAQVTLEARNVRSLRASLDDATVRAGLMQAVFEGAGSLLRHLRSDEADLAAGRLELCHEDVTHLFRFPQRLQRTGFSYRRDAPRSSPSPEAALQSEEDEHARTAEAVALDIAYPVEELELTLELPAGSPPPSLRCFVAPDMAVPPMGAFTLARALHPEGFRTAWDSGRRRLTVKVQHPLPVLRYGFAWSLSEDAPEGFLALEDRKGKPRSFVVGGLFAKPVGADEPPQDLAARLREGREQAGYSCRQLATRMQVSPATVIAAEKGRDPRASTLRRYVEELPGLQPEDLFVEPRHDVPIDGETAWLYYRNVTGMEAAEATRTLELTPEGDALEVIGTRGLRRGSSGTGDLIVKDGITRAAHGTVGPVYVEQGTGEQEEDLRIRWIRLPHDQPEFHLFVPAALADSGVSFTRREHKEKTYKMRADQLNRSIGPAYECFVPLSRLVLTVRFPEGYWPLKVEALVRPGVNITNASWPDLAGELHPEGFRLRRYRSTGAVRLVVDRPLLGFRYAVRWLAP